MACHQGKVNISVSLHAATAVASTCSPHPGICNVWHTFVKLQGPQTAQNRRASKGNFVLLLRRFSTIPSLRISNMRQTLQIAGCGEHVLAAAATARKYHDFDPRCSDNACVTIAHLSPEQLCLFSQVFFSTISYVRQKDII